ncbi:MAG: TlpA disulfide reductase family protein [Gammaproteobacteria bacterium]
MPIIHRLARSPAVLLSCAALLAAALAAPVAAAPGLRDLNGQPRTIADYTGHGKWLVVMIWASDCGVCNTEAHSYVDFYNTHRDQDASVLGISMDGWAGRADAEAFIRRHHVTFPNLIGEPEAVAELFGKLTGRPWFGTPTFLIYDPSGELRVQQVGAVPVKLIEQYIRSHSKTAPDRARAPAGGAGGGLAMAR